MNAAIEEYPVVSYNPSHYIPVKVFRHQWETAKEDGFNRVEDPYGQNPEASSFAAALHSMSPYVVTVAMLVIILNTMGVRSADAQASLGVHLGNPAMWIAITAFVLGLSSLFKKISFAAKVKNAVDFSLLESARRYLIQRYDILPEGWEDRFISYLVGEEVKENRFSKDYELVVKNYKGFNVIMIANINGEAPVKN